MKSTLYICAVIAVFAASASAQMSLPSLMPAASMSNFQTLYKVVSTVHSVLSKTPFLSQFLPSPMTMAMNAYKVYNAANNFEEGMKKAGESVTNMVQKAAEQAKLPAESISKITEQVSQLWNQGQSAAGQASQTASAAVSSAANNVVGSAAPVF